MTASEGGERLARVTYLPGVVPPAQQARAEAPALSVPVAPARPESDTIEIRQPEVATPEFTEPEFTEPEFATPEFTKLEEHSLRALTRRGLSRRELERELRARDYAPDEVEAELDRLETTGLIDDTALAQHLVATLQERKGYGRSAIAAELVRRLLSPAAIEYALELVDGNDELARARDLAVKRASQLSGYDRETAVRRLTGYLARRGYSGSTVRTAVEQALPQRAASGVRFR